MKNRDYSSFSSTAKSRFRPVAAELGFEQISGISYARKRDGWYEAFNLQASSYGSDFFYVNYGIAVPQLAPESEPRDIRDTGLLLSDRLRDVDGTGAFDSASKAAVEAAAGRVLGQLKEIALPWFQSHGSWEAIAAEYYRVNPIEEESIGKHCVDYGADFRSAVYGYLLLRAGRTEDAVRWLSEAKRLLSLPVYFTRDGRTVHEKEKFARLQKPSPHDVDRLRGVERTLERLGGG